MTCKLRTIMSVLLVAVALLLTGTVHYFAGNVSDHSSGAVSDHLLDRRGSLSNTRRLIFDELVEVCNLT